MSDGGTPAPWQPAATVPPEPQSGWTTDNDPAYWKGRQLHDPIVGPRVWASADYLFWFVKGANAPPLVEAISPQATSLSQAQPLYPAGTIDFKTLNGIRGTLGFWFTPGETIGFESSYFWFGANSIGASFASSPTAILGRPFFNAAAGGSEGIYQLSSPGVANGYATVNSTFHMEGGDANLLLGSLPFAPRVTLLGGFRYLEINESLRVDEYTANPNNGFTASSFDSFATRNQFFGGQLGTRWAYTGDRLLVSLTGKVAYGAMLEHVGIDGATTVNNPGSGVSSASGGVLALPSNIGSYDRTRMTFIPEGLANVGYRFTSWATASLGYTFIYVSNMVRPGSQINPNVSPQNLPFSGGSATGPQPSFSFHNDTLWVQGLNFAFTFTY